MISHVVETQRMSNEIRGRLRQVARNHSCGQTSQADEKASMSAIREWEMAGTPQNPIEDIISRRCACRAFSDAPVPRRTIEEVLGVARFPPSGANIQPWQVYVLAGAAKERVSAALLEAHGRSREQHLSEYKYYSSELPEPYLSRRQEFGRLFLRLSWDRSSRCPSPEQSNCEELHILRRASRLDRDDLPSIGTESWLDLGMFLQNVLLAAAARGLQSCPQETFSKYHLVLRELLSIPSNRWWSAAHRSVARSFRWSKD
jgi:nitroreductase